MTHRGKWLLLMIAVAVAGASAFTVWMHLPKSEMATTRPPPDAADDAVGTVQTAVIRLGELDQVLTVYGSAVAAPGATSLVSVGADVRVGELRVAPGQAVKKGAPLLDVQPTADASLQLTEAGNTLAAADKYLADAKERFDLKLAANSDLLAAQQSAQSAQVKLADLVKRGIGDGPQTIYADADSFVSKVDVLDGQLVPAAAPLVELVRSDRIEVQLGIDPTDASQIKPGQSVRLLTDASGDDSFAGTFRAISRRINPDTRLIDAFVTPAPGMPLLLDTFARGEFTLRRERSMLVPRDAVLPEGDGFSLFTVKEGHAVKHTVKVSMQDDRDAAITGDVHAGDVVVITGNLELDDGMAVSAGEAK